MLALSLTHRPPADASGSRQAPRRWSSDTTMATIANGRAAWVTRSAVRKAWRWPIGSARSRSSRFTVKALNGPSTQSGGRRATLMPSTAKPSAQLLRL
jgi:hypothetical protein